jgi:hypothetical protein
MANSLERIWEVSTTSEVHYVSKTSLGTSLLGSPQVALLVLVGHGHASVFLRRNSKMYHSTCQQ